ncbi:hypothetical protein AVEN_75153-1 [Araneus ventricosus]|uniref:Uncharacterized protein n=1 Tax=Araneus ventricosus TaxID=182803 RepID=A0A4Y2MY66_ARAVE|nr:hypothetical protein AVEN_75153-1 [Araneus ventricosus]
MYFKGIFGSEFKCPLVYVPLCVAMGDQGRVVHQQILCALAEVLAEDVLLPPDVLNMLRGVRSEESSLAGHSQELSRNSGNLELKTELGFHLGLCKRKHKIMLSSRNLKGNLLHGEMKWERLILRTGK